MAEAQAKNRYTKIPYEFFRRGLSCAAVAVFGKIFTFSTLVNVKSVCRSSYRDFARDFGISERQVARTIKDLKIKNYVSQDKSMRSCAAYTYTGEQCANGYIQTDLYLYQSEFDIEGEGTRYLTLSEIYVLSLIITHCSNPKKEECTSSIRGMGKTLGISAATVQRCISTLKRAELIFVKKRAVNGSGWTEYVVNEKLLRRREKSYRKTMKPQESPRVFVSPEVAAANARADRERYYSIARDHANAPVESTLRRLRTNQDYVAAENAVKKLDIEIARKDVYGTANEVATLQREQNRWKAAMAERMADMNISPDDLKPRYRCAKCSDTGFLPNGTACDCYPGNK